MQIESRRSERSSLRRDGIPDFLAAGQSADGDFRCAACGYGISVRRVLPECPMCRGSQWEEPATSPYGRVVT